VYSIWFSRQNILELMW